MGRLPEDGVAGFDFSPEGFLLVKRGADVAIGGTRSHSRRSRRRINSEPVSRAFVNARALRIRPDVTGQLISSTIVLSFDAEEERVGRNTPRTVPAAAGKSCKRSCNPVRIARRNADRGRAGKRKSAGHPSRMPFV